MWFYTFYIDAIVMLHLELRYCLWGGTSLGVTHHPVLIDGECRSPMMKSKCWPVWRYRYVSLHGARQAKAFYHVFVFWYLRARSTFSCKRTHFDEKKQGDFLRFFKYDDLFSFLHFLLYLSELNLSNLCTAYSSESIISNNFFIHSILRFLKQEI